MTEEKDIKELQREIIKTIIKFISEKNLTDIECITFNADGLQSSVEYGSWHPGTDSCITVEGIKYETVLREDGKTLEIPYRYEIGKYL